MPRGTRRNTRRSARSSARSSTRSSTHSSTRGSTRSTAPQTREVARVGADGGSAGRGRSRTRGAPAAPAVDSPPASGDDESVDIDADWDRDVAHAAMRRSPRAPRPRRDNEFFYSQEMLPVLSGRGARASDTSEEGGQGRDEHECPVPVDVYIESNDEGSSTSEEDTDSEFSDDDEDAEVVAAIFEDAETEDTPAGGRNNAQWTEDRLASLSETDFFQQHPEDWESGPTVNPNSIREAFDAYFTDKVWNMLVTSTNNHMRLKQAAERHQLALQLKSPKRKEAVKVTLAEMKGFIAILIAKGLRAIPAMEDNWSDDPFWRSQFIADIMSRNRFREIKRYFSVANPSADENRRDRLAKTRPFLDLVRSIMQSNYVPGRKLGLDESQAQCFSRFARCSHRGEQKKPISDYVKILAVHESGTGALVNFEVDTREKSIVDMLEQLCRPLRQGERVYTVAVDRFYNSVGNVKQLWRTCRVLMYGTIRTDRGVPSALIRDVRDNGLEDGEHRFMMANAGPITLTCSARHEETGCYFLSSFHNPEQTTTVQRRKRKEGIVDKSAPIVAADYNEDMGPVDQSNSLKASYSLYAIHRRRWYMTLVYYGLDMLLVNAFIVWKLSHPKAVHKDFRKQIALELAREALLERRNGPASGQRRASNGITPNRSGRIIRCIPAAATRVCTGGHVPVRARNDSASCRLCRFEKGENKVTCWTCELCKTPLCIKKDRNCFERWHTVEHIPPFQKQ